MFLRPAFLKFLCVASLIGGARPAVAALALVQDADESHEIALTTDPTPVPSEAQACAQSLTTLRNTGLAAELQKIVWDDHHVEQAIANMKRAGQLTDPLDETRVRLQLKLGVILGPEGLLHEAIYSVFSTRYKSKKEIRDALKSFRYITDDAEALVLVSEVIERVLQYIPDVDTANLNRINETAAFLNMNEDQLASFRKQWLVYDGNDEFAVLLQNGLASILTAATDQLVTDVQARAGLFRRLLLGMKAIDVPARPRPINAEVTERQIQIEDRGYYVDEDLATYLAKSSSAARRFFISNRAKFFTVAQIEHIMDRREAWYLDDKVTLVESLRDQLAKRSVLHAKFAIFDDLRRDLADARLQLKRVRDRKAYDPAQNLKGFGAMRDMKADQIRQMAIQVLEEIHVICEPHQFRSVVTSILRNGVNLQGNRDATIKFIDATVDYANLVGLDADEVNEVQRRLIDLGSKLSGNDQAVARDRAVQIRVANLKFNGKTEDELKTAIDQLVPMVFAAKADLDAAYERGR